MSLSSELSRFVNRKQWLPLRRSTTGRVNYIMPYGFGRCFARCWTAERTWVHQADGLCPNCECPASAGFASLHFAINMSDRTPVALMLPQVATIHLLRAEPLDHELEYPQVAVSRPAGAGRSVQVEFSARARQRPLETSEENAADKQLVLTALHFFRGKIEDPSPDDLFLPWIRALHVVE